MKFWYIVVTTNTDLGLNSFPYLVFECALWHSSKSSTGQANIQPGRTRKYHPKARSYIEFIEYFKLSLNNMYIMVYW